LTNNFTNVFVDNKLEKLFALNLWGIKGLTDEGVTIICRACTNITSLTLCDCPELTENSMISVLAMLSGLTTLNLWGCAGFSNASLQLMIRHGTKLQGKKWGTGGLKSRSHAFIL
jgi:hypothetical protein